MAKKKTAAAKPAKTAPETAKTTAQASGMTEMQRVFKYNGIELPEVGSALSVDEAKDFYAQAYPGIINCAVKGPTEDGDKLVYQFVQNTGTRG